MKSPSELRRCSRCKQYKPKSEFYVKTAELHRLGSRCKPCHNAAEIARRAARSQTAGDQARLLEILHQHGALPGPELAAAAGMPSWQIGHVMKAVTRAGDAVLVSRWGPNGQSLYALPGQPIPERRDTAPINPQVKAAIDADCNAWFANLASSVAERAAARNVMRGRGMSAIPRYQVIQRIRAVLDDIGWHAASQRLGVTTIHLAAVLSNRREPSKKLLTALKLRKVVMYEEIT